MQWKEIMLWNDFLIIFKKIGCIFVDNSVFITIKAGNDAIESIDDLTPEMKAGADVAVADLKNGTIDVLINDLTVTKAYMDKAPGSIKIAGNVLNAESYGFAVQKGNKELLKKINHGIKNLKKDGTYDELFKKWFE